MAKASLILPDGTTVTIEGNAEEIRKIISLHHLPDNNFKALPKSASKIKEHKSSDKSDESNINLSKFVQTIKDCDEAEKIETNILDRTGQVDKILLPLYISKKYFHNKLELTSGNISKILGDLGINIFQSNIANALSGAASKYVIGDKVRRKGQITRYKISRRGEKYLEAVIENTND